MLIKTDPIEDTIPHSAAELGMAEQFRYWQGGSGRRYLFTEVPLDALRHYRDAILVLTRQEDGRSVLWIGEIDQMNRWTNPWDRRQIRRADGAYVHFLAGNRDERRRVIDDIAEAA